MTPAPRVLLMGLNYAPEPTGIAPYTTGLAHFLAEAGHDVHVITGLPHYPWWEVQEGYGPGQTEEEHGKVRVIRVPHPVPGVPSGRTRVGMELAFAMRSAAVRLPRPDLVVAVSPALLSVPAAWRWRSSGRTALGVVCQDIYHRALTETGTLSGAGARAARSLERGLLRRADGIVAIHPSFRRSLETLGVDGERITTIRNWTHVGTAVGDVGRARQSLGWRADEVVALHAGNMGAKQGLENVVEAARLADETSAPVRFVLMGTGHQRSRLEGLARGVERLQFVDPLPDGRFETALAAADVLVLNELPGIAEMCVPSKLTSYFASGTPVVAATGPLSAASHEMDEARSGVRVPPGQPAALLAAVRSLASDPLRREMGERGRLFASDTLARATARTEYVRWAEELMGPRAPAPVPATRRPRFARLYGRAPARPVRRTTHEEPV